MNVKAKVFIKGTEEKTGKDNRIYKNVLVYGIEGQACDLALSCEHSEMLFMQAKEEAFKPAEITIDIFNTPWGVRFKLVALDALKEPFARPANF